MTHSESQSKKPPVFIIAGLIVLWAALYPIPKTWLVMRDSGDMYAISGSYGISILFYLAATYAFQSLPFALLSLFSLIIPFPLHWVRNLTCIVSVLFLAGGAAAGILMRDHAYSALQVTYYLDSAVVSIYMVFRSLCGVGPRPYRIALILFVWFALSFGLNVSGLPERALDLAFQRRYVCHRDRGQGLFNLYDNLKGEELVPFISNVCIWYYPDLDLARISRQGTFELMNVKSGLNIVPLPARDIGPYAEGLFRIETTICDRYPSQYPSSYREFCRTGFLDTYGKWIIPPKYYLVSDFNHGHARVGIVPSEAPTEIRNVCIDTTGRIVKSLDNSVYECF